MDGHFVPPITIGADVAKAITPAVHAAGAILDVHLMVERPERHVDAFVEAGADRILVQVESTPNVHYAVKAIRDAGRSPGVVINPGTPVEAVEPVADLIDLCLVMSVNPGWGGQRYIPSSTGRVAKLRAMLPPEVVLEIDGGISLETIDEARDAGVDLFVAGSSVFGADDPAAAFGALAARL
jgi:ribulose-phosphate 3-epimerase